MEKWLQGLNECQYQAVSAKEQSVLVLAGAGSGKTRVLVNRMAWLIEKEHISPHSIVAVTFTNKAAGELRARLQELLDISVAGLWVGTFHGLCHRLLRRHYKEANLSAHFHILDSEDQARHLKRVMLGLNLNLEEWPVKQAQHFINSNKDEGLRPHQIHQKSYGPTQTLIKVYSAYESLCLKAGVLDFAELILRTLELFNNHEDLKAHYQNRFAAILVDEFQDTNACQYAWIKMLCAHHTKVMAVGDDDQSIYGWRGAQVENIHRFSQDFVACQVIRLEQNYRSTANILNAANALISNNDSRMGKNLWTKDSDGEKIHLFSAFNELEEARFVVDRIGMLVQRGTRESEIAVLYRSNAQSRLFEESLLRANIPYRIYGGVRFFERAEIKDCLAYLRLVSNVADDASFERVVNFPTRGIGERTLEEVRKCAKDEDCSLYNACEIVINKSVLSSRASNALSQFLALIAELQQTLDNLCLDEQIKQLIKLSGLHDHYSKEKSDKGESRLENLQELVNAAKEFRYEYDPEEPLPILTAFLAHASLEAGERQAEPGQEYVHLMTMHSAKGLEFPIVFMVGMEEGVFPSRLSVEDPRRLEEERRLCYVGMTRAMQCLFLTYAEIRRQYGREEYHKSSRFLREIPREFIHEIRAQTKSNPVAFKMQSSLAHESGYNIGQAVNHSKFGPGIVLAIEGSGAHTRVQVKFSEDGIKWLVLAYANLT